MTYAHCPRCGHEGVPEGSMDEEVDEDGTRRLVEVYVGRHWSGQSVDLLDVCAHEWQEVWVYQRQRHEVH